MSVWDGKKVVLGITGGIAAYKAAEVCRLLRKRGAAVRVVMTDAACQFITPLTMQTLSGAPVGRSLFDPAEEAQIGHIRLADEADLVVVAPATADFLARVAAGMANDLLTAVVLATRAPILLAPAMNVNMWQHPLTQGNLARLQGLGPFHTVGPEAGFLACGWEGQGRMAEPEAIVERAESLVGPQDLAGRKVVISAGPTHEPVDDVRFLGNRSSGRMGFALAEAAVERGAQVTLVAGPVALPTPPRCKRIDVQTALEMQRAVSEASVEADLVVMAAAVADFRPRRKAEGKLSRRKGEAAALDLEPNPDILAELGRSRGGKRRPLLVGFAAEIAGDAERLLERARGKLAEKGCDVVVANDVGVAGLGFGSDQNAVTLVFRDGEPVSLPAASKKLLAHQIWTQLVARF